MLCQVKHGQDLCIVLPYIPNWRLHDEVFKGIIWFNRREVFVKDPDLFIIVPTGWTMEDVFKAQLYAIHTILN